MGFEIDIQNEELLAEKLRAILGPPDESGITGITCVAAEKTADTADNPANEKDGADAIKVKTDADIKVTAAINPAQRIQELEALIKSEEISEANGARPQLDDAGNVKQDPTTCGNCGMTWNDALITGRTPAPAARCPYEDIHPEIKELARLKRQHAASVKKVAYVAHVPGHKNSKGETAPWVIKQHETGKILESFKSEGAAKEGLKNMESHKHGSKTAHQAFDVYLDGKNIDTVFYGDGVNVDKDEVKRSLVNHDGYDPNIIVRKSRKAAVPSQLEGFKPMASVKVASKRVVYARVANVKKATSIEVRVDEKKGDVFAEILKKLNERHAAMKAKNPQGFLDQFEQQLPTIMIEIAQGLGLKVREDDHGNFIFTDEMGAGLSDDRARELLHQNAAAHKPGCDCGFCQNKGSFGKKEDGKDEKKESKTAEQLGLGQAHPLVHVDTDNEKWGRVVGDGTVVEDQGDMFLVQMHHGPHDARMLILVPKADAHTRTASDKTAGRGQFPHHMTGVLPNEMDDAIVIAAMHQLEVPHRFNPAGVTAAAENDAESGRTKRSRQTKEEKLAKLRRLAVPDDSDDILSEMMEPMGCPSQVKVKDGDGRPDGATPKLADSAVDWFVIPTVTSRASRRKTSRSSWKFRNPSR